MNKDLFNKILSVEGVPKKFKYVQSILSKSDRSLTIKFIAPKAVDSFVEKEIAKVVKSYLPQSFNSIKIEINKIITVESFVKSAVVKYLQEEHHIACSSVVEDNVFVEQRADDFLITLSLETTVYDFCVYKKVDRELIEHLDTKFVDDFEIKFVNRGKDEIDESVFKTKTREVTGFYKRTLQVSDVTKYFDDDPTDRATYIADTKDMLGEVYLAGVISNVKCGITKNDKEYFIIDFSDRTGTASGMLFPNKDKVAKAKKLDKGVAIICRCEYQMRGEYRNLRILSVNLCVFPENFVPVSRPKKPVPKEYYLVSPKPMQISSQDNFLEHKEIPSAFIGREFVVFDIETTGTDFDDKITEIGAVKVIDGEIVESFATLINPKKHIPANIVEITGIDDEMVKDAPLFEDVCADFYKFCYGATIVAHNADFDTRFIRNQSKPLDYDFDNPVLDTLAIGREVVVGVANYKLNTLCDKFGIVFHHHRALSDAQATAELFIELIRIRKEIP